MGAGAASAPSTDLSSASAKPWLFAHQAKNSPKSIWSSPSSSISRIAASQAALTPAAGMPLLLNALSY